MTAAYLVGWTLYYLWFWTRAMVPNDAGGIDAGHVNIWGDWAIHYTMGSAMAYRDLILDNNPLLVGVAFKYPFFSNFLSAVLVRLGMPFFTSFTTPSFVFCVMSIWALRRFFKNLLGSPNLAVVASMIFMLNGGLGFIKYFFDVMGTSDWKTFFFPPYVYSNLSRASIYWINVVESMFIPQRSFQMGFPMTCMILSGVLTSHGPRLAPPTSEPDAWDTPRRAFIIGLALGFLPIVHVHAFGCALVILTIWGLWDIKRRQIDRGAAVRWWRSLAAGTALLGIPIVCRFFLGAEHLSLMKFAPGWYGDESLKFWFVFWGRNWGPTLISGIIGLTGLLVLARGRRAATLVFVLPFLIFFAIANLWIIHPWMWDNTKLIVWASLGFSPLAAVPAGALWRVTGMKRLATKFIAMVGLILMCLTGAIDVYRIMLPSLNRHEMYTNEALYLADWARKNTPVDSIWLTGDDHSNWVFNLTGRQCIETYIGWLWTHGYTYKPIDRDVEAMYGDPARDDLFRKYHVNYILIGDYEVQAMDVDRQDYEKRFPVAIRTDHYTVYRYAPNQKKEQEIVRTAPRPALPLSLALKPGLVRKTFKGKYFFGKPLIKEGDSDINFEYNAEEPKPFAVPGSIEWAGYLKVPEKRDYRFVLVSDDGAWLDIDGIQLIDNGGNHPAESVEATVNLSEGYHHIRLRYFDSGGGAVLKFSWQAIGEGALMDSEGLFH